MKKMPLVIAALGFSLIASGAEDKVQLVRKYEKDHVNLYTAKMDMKMNSNTTIPVGGQTQSMTMMTNIDMSSYLQVKVIDVTDGVGKLEVKVESVKAKQNISGPMSMEINVLWDEKGKSITGADGQPLNLGPQADQMLEGISGPKTFQYSRTAKNKVANPADLTKVATLKDAVLSIVVNGQVAYHNGQHTAAGAGQMLRFRRSPFSPA